MALRQSDDTEFNDALRAHGILPRLPTPERSPSPEVAPTSQDRLEAGEDLSDDELLGLEDDLPASVLDAYREARMKELQAVTKTHRFNGMREVSRDDYTREVTESSKEDVDLSHPGTGVVCFLYKDSVPESQLLRRHLDALALRYPATKFVCIVGDRCIPNYPDRNIPTLLLYRQGELVKQLIGLGGKGMRTTQTDIEAVLTTCVTLRCLQAARGLMRDSAGILDSDLKVPSQQGESDDEDDSD